MTDSGFCSYTNPSRATIPLIRPHQCDSEGGRIRGVLLYSLSETSKINVFIRKQFSITGETLVDFRFHCTVNQCMRGGDVCGDVNYTSVATALFLRFQSGVTLR